MPEKCGVSVGTMMKYMSSIRNQFWFWIAQVENSLAKPANDTRGIRIKIRKSQKKNRSSTSDTLCHSRPMCSWSDNLHLFLSRRICPFKGPAIKFIILILFVPDLSLFGALPFGELRWLGGFAVFCSFAITSSSSHSKTTHFLCLCRHFWAPCRHIMGARTSKITIRIQRGGSLSSPW